MGDSYFLYLVDDDCIDKEDYEPTIIQNPVKAVLQSDEWLKNPDSLSIERVMTGGYHSTTVITSIQDKENELLRKEIKDKDAEIARLKKELADALVGAGPTQPTIEVRGDYVVNKNVENEVSNVEDGGTGINVNKAMNRQ